MLVLIATIAENKVFCTYFTGSANAEDLGSHVFVRSSAARGTRVWRASSSRA